MPLTLRYVTHSEIGLVRKNNQDSGYASPNLLVVADDHDLPRHVQRDQRIEIGLAGLVDDHQVEPRRARIRPSAAKRS